MEQNDEVRLELIRKSKLGGSIREVLTKFSKWIELNRVKFVWGKGPSFDCALLHSAYDKLELPRPWDFWNERCVRTIFAFNPKAPKEIPFEGQPHRGIDDCKHQIKGVTENLKEMTSSPQPSNVEEVDNNQLQIEFQNNLKMILINLSIIFFFSLKIFEK